MADTVCSFDGCGPAKRLARGLCSTHYLQHRRGEPLTPKKWRWHAKTGAKCSFDGCGKLVKSADLCAGHYKQRRAGQPLRTLRKLSAGSEGPCSFGGCINRASVAGLCGTHYELQRRGESLRPLRHRGTGRSDRDQYLRFAYSISEAEYEAMVEAQGGVCAACGLPDNPDRRLSVDHDHACCPESGRSCGRCIRGAICDRCNLAAGQARDDVARLRGIADYLERYAARTTSAAA